MVLVVNMVILLGHTYDVQRRFRVVKNQEVFSSLQNAAYIMDGNNDEVAVNMYQIAEAIAHDPDEIATDEGIFNVLTNCNASGRYLSLSYVNADGIMYSDSGNRQQLDPDVLDEIRMHKEAECIVSSFETTEDENGVLIYFQPLMIDDEDAGMLMGKVGCDKFFEEEAFSGLKDDGDVFLMAQDGRILLRDARIFAEDGLQAVNLFELLHTKAIDAHSKKQIQDIKQLCRPHDGSGNLRNRYLKTEMVDDAGRKIMLGMRALSGVKDVYLVSVFPETVYTSVTKALLFRTLLSSSILFLITIFMLLYMWWTSKNSSDIIKKLAYEDPITGGKNDNYFREVAGYYISSNSNIPYVVTRFDIANFRYINEAYGHNRADELLRIIVKECERIFSSKELIARMTADQFLLLARNDQNLEAKFEELLQVINEQAKEIGIMFPIRLKRGVYNIRRDDSDIGIIIDHANAARKSLSGDEKVLVATYSEQIISQMFLNDKIESEMEKAMEDEEFKVFIQAKWDIRRDHVHGGEALVRWIKPDGSRIFPDQFIPVFEKNGFVEKLDMYMLEQVCKHQRKLIDAGKEIYPISVNQSRLLMHNPDYLPQVERLMKKYRIPNGYVEIEITETVFQDERSLMIHTTNELKKMDIQLAMDDFGSGYSSLNMLKDVPFDVIKIDREFFSESITSRASVWILRKIIEMAEGLGIRTLCEGVENEEQVKLLRDLGCYYVQGYFYSKPMPFDEYIGLYCHEKEGGKQYYDKLYEEQAAARETRREQEEKEQSVTAANIVQEFKKKIADAPKEEKKKEERIKEKEEGGKKVSSEEMKLAYLKSAEEKQKDKEDRSEASKDENDVAAKDGGSEKKEEKKEEKTARQAREEAQKAAVAVTGAKSAAEAVKAMANAKKAAEEAAEARRREKEAGEKAKIVSAEEAVRQMKQREQERLAEKEKENNERK